MTSPAEVLAPGELFKVAYPELAGWVRRQVDDDDTAHKIASEAFVRLLARWTKVKDPHSYLSAVAADLIRDHDRTTERSHRRSNPQGARRTKMILTAGRHRLATRPQPMAVKKQQRCPT